MQILLWIIFLIAVGIAIFAIQNSDASHVTIKFLIWRFETSLVYAILGSFVLGVLVTLLFWVSRVIRTTLWGKKSHQESS